LTDCRQLALTPLESNPANKTLCRELQLQYNYKMKTATIPPIRVAPEFRIEVEGILEHGESLSEFVENAVRQTVLKRKNQAEFLRRGIAAIEETKRAGGGIAAETVVAKLEVKLAAARRTQSQRS
jgi:hypothetical protein